jgi:NAD(P)-dependent dehydrogenase (short-subunit alcohol dehydrogenase family)
MPKDPRSTGPRPPFPRQPQSAPGRTLALDPKPDHGEETYRGSGQFSGCSVLITGADSGIGRAVAIAFAREGADVLVSYLEEHDDARETGEWIERAGRRALLIAGDIGDAGHCESLVKTCMDEFGRLDVLINNAAYQRTHKQTEDFSPEEVQRTFRTNIESMFFLTRAATPRMRPGGSIINTTSIQANDPSPELLAYAATKAAIANFTVGLAQSLGEKGIRVNAVAPGPVWTPLIPSTMPVEKVSQFGANTPLGRPAQPAELAPAYVFLASDAASYISGAILPLTGGRPML